MSESEQRRPADRIAPEARREIDEWWAIVEAEDDNSTVGATGAYYPPDTRSDEEKRRDRRRFLRRQFVNLWKWRLRGLLPRGWK